MTRSYYRLKLMNTQFEKESVFEVDFQSFGLGKLQFK